MTLLLVLVRRVPTSECREFYTGATAFLALSRATECSDNCYQQTGARGGIPSDVLAQSTDQEQTSAQSGGIMPCDGQADAPGLPRVTDGRWSSRRLANF